MDRQSSGIERGRIRNGWTDIFTMEAGPDPLPAAILSGVLEYLGGDQAWMAVRRKLRGRWPIDAELLPIPGPRKGYEPGTVILGPGCVDLADIRDKFYFYARVAGVDPGFCSDVDLVSAAVALELWSSVFYMDVWEGAQKCAGIEGPDALNSFTAIVARALGSGVACMPLDPGLPHVNFESQILFTTARLCRDFSDRNLGEASWPHVVENVVSDLGYRAIGKSRTHNASLLLGLCLLNI